MFTKQKTFSEKRLIYNYSEINDPVKAVESIVNQRPKNQETAPKNLDQEISKCVDRLKTYTNWPEKCQALINAFYKVAETNDFCQKNPPWNDGWQIWKFVASLLETTMSLLLDTAQAEAAELKPGNIPEIGEFTEFYRINEPFGNEVRAKKIHEVVKPDQSLSIVIKNNLGQIQKGQYNIVWNGNTYVFEDYPNLGRVKIMPWDLLLNYQEKNENDSKGQWFQIPKWAPNVVKDFFGEEKLESAEILKKAKEADIVFQTSTSRQSEVIQLATNSPISHMWILLKHNGSLQVLEAVQPVKITPFEEWKTRGEGGQISIKRLDSEFDVEEVLKEAKRKIGKSYDSLFGWDDSKIYCSELIFDAFKSQGIEIWETTTFKDLDFSSLKVQRLFLERLGLRLTNQKWRILSDLLKKHKTIWNLMQSKDWVKIKKQVPQKILTFIDQPVITPASMFNANNLETVYSEY